MTGTMTRLLYISIGIVLSGLTSFVGWCFYQYYCSNKTQSILEQSILEQSIRESKSHRDTLIRPELQTTTRVYFDSLSGINETRSYFIDESEIDDVNLNPNDNHNVHNVTIVNSIKNKMPLLYESSQTKFSFVTVIQQIKVCLALVKTKYPYVSKVLRFILESRASYSSQLIKEFEIIRLIWTRINHPNNETNKASLVDEFLLQLNDCFNVEEESVCCLEGRVVRYFQALELCDYQSELWALVPLWIYKNEIEHRCAKGLNQMVQGLPLEDQLVYFKQDPTSGEKIRVDAWNKQLVDDLEKALQQEYGDKLDERQLSALTKPCFQAIVG